MTYAAREMWLKALYAEGEVYGPSGWIVHSWGDDWVAWP
jgi:hypothetical protein